MSSSTEQTKEDKSLVDINDLSLNEEPIGDFDANADPFERQGPLRAGTYMANLSFAEEDPSKRWTKYPNKKGGHYFATALIATIADPQGGPTDGRKVYDRFVSTMVRNGTSTVAGILRAIGRSNEEIAELAAQGHLAMARELANALAGEPQCLIETDWEAEARDKVPNAETGKDDYVTAIRKVGMKNFPPLKDSATGHAKKDDQGNQLYQPFILHPKTGEEVPARAAINRYMPLA